MKLAERIRQTLEDLLADIMQERDIRRGDISPIQSLEFDEKCGEIDKLFDELLEQNKNVITGRGIEGVRVLSETVQCTGGGCDYIEAEVEYYKDGRRSVVFVKSDGSYQFITTVSIEDTYLMDGTGEERWFDFSDDELLANKEFDEIAKENVKRAKDYYEGEYEKMYPERIVNFPEFVCLKKDGQTYRELFREVFDGCESIYGYPVGDMAKSAEAVKLEGEYEEAPPHYDFNEMVFRIASLISDQHLSEQVEMKGAKDGGLQISFEHNGQRYVVECRKEVGPKKYTAKAVISETLSRKIEVPVENAGDHQSVIQKLKDMYDSGEIILTSDDYSETKVEVSIDDEPFGVTEVIRHA